MTSLESEGVPGENDDDVDENENENDDKDDDDDERASERAISGSMNRVRVNSYISRISTVA